MYSNSVLLSAKVSFIRVLRVLAVRKTLMKLTLAVMKVIGGYSDEAHLQLVKIQAGSNYTVPDRKTLLIEHYLYLVGFLKQIRLVLSG